MKMGEQPVIKRPYKTNKQSNVQFETLITIYNLSLRRFAYNYVRDWGIVDDIMQEVYVKAFLKINTLHSDAAIKSWLFSITANQCKDYLRVKYVKTTVLTDNFDTLIVTNKECVEKEVINNSDMNILKRIIFS
jgi:RNA polymerase sigma-70 factor, ECF subfamily